MQVRYKITNIYKHQILILLHRKQNRKALFIEVGEEKLYQRRNKRMGRKVVTVTVTVTEMIWKAT